MFEKYEAPISLKQKYIKLLEKFEVALKINESQVLIPSLMPDHASYPKPNDMLSDVSRNVDNYYMPPMRRFWLSNFIPDGFWPRLICRIATDQQIAKVCVHTYMYVHDSPAELLKPAFSLCVPCTLS